MGANIDYRDCTAAKLIVPASPVSSAEVVEVISAPLRSEAAAERRSKIVQRAQSIAWLAAPVIFLAWLYSRTFRIWFREDDFPLLWWVRQIHSLHDFRDLMFSPYAQGTIRPLSERLPFLISWNLFGEDGIPLRIFVFLTAMADMWLLAWITRRLTGSRLAGAAAAVFWIASPSLITPMTWDSAYNEVQYQFFLLAALALFIRYADTGRRWYWWAQLAVFVVGFGSLENNVVYPAIAVAWTLLTTDRAKWKRLILSTVPLFVISAVYYVVHMRIAPAPKTGIYAMHVDWRIARTFWEYWRWAFLAPESTDFSIVNGRRAIFILVIAMGAFCAFLLWQLRRRRIAVLFGVAWFVLTFSPMLLLPDRHTEYYLGGPAMGLAIVAGAAVARSWRSGWLWRLGAMLPAILWLAAAVPAVRAATIHFVEYSKLSRNLVLGVEEARENHPGKTILLDGVSQDAYQAGIFEGSFRAFGMENVYLTPGARKTIHPDDNDHGFESMVVDPAVTRNALENDQAVVFDFSRGHLKNVTSPYRQYATGNFTDAPPRRVQVANPLYAYLLGPEWLGTEGFVRWMPGKATVKIGGPDSAAQHLGIVGFCWDQQLRKGPIHLAISADGIPVGLADIAGPDDRFERSFALPGALAGRSAVEIELDASPVAKLGSREYGVMVESLSIQ